MALHIPGLTTDKYGWNSELPTALDGNLPHGISTNPCKGWLLDYMDNNPFIT
jgi:hypothetical protein